MTTNDIIRELLDNLPAELGEFVDKLPEARRPMLRDPVYQNDEQAWNRYAMNEGNYNPAPWMQDRY